MLDLAVAAGSRNHDGYTYAQAGEGSPETLTIWHDGRVVLTSAANTGSPAAPTADGTFPVYLRYRFQIMQGTNPDGRHYAGPVSFVAYFNGGEAVHYSRAAPTAPSRSWAAWNCLTGPLRWPGRLSRTGASSPYRADVTNL